MTARTDPIVVLGMHRSGTELVSKLLTDRGVFMGAHLDKHGECKFFQRFNIWMLEKHGARWDVPEAFDCVVQNPRLRTELAEYLAARLRGPRILGYFGADRFLRGWNGLGAWGWKDPRTTLTLPIWLEVMKDLKAVYLVRHGVDVAQSLWVREQKNFAILSAHHDLMIRAPWRNLYTVYEKRSGFALSPRSLELEGCFSLWESYLGKAAALRERLGERMLTIRYEDLLQNPEPEAARLFRFCNLRISPAEIKRAVAPIDASRVYAYRDSPELRDYASRVRSRLEHFGYSI